MGHSLKTYAPLLGPTCIIFVSTQKATIADRNKKYPQSMLFGKLILAFSQIILYA